MRDGKVRWQTEDGDGAVAVIMQRSLWPFGHGDNAFRMENPIQGPRYGDLLWTTSP
jgi:hypothetical protein